MRSQQPSEIQMEVTGGSAGAAPTRGSDLGLVTAAADAAPRSGQRGRLHAATVQKIAEQPIRHGPNGRRVANRKGGKQGEQPALARLRSELSRAEARILTLEAERLQREADRTRLAEEQARLRRSLEQSLTLLGEELGNALAERSASDLHAERLAEALVTLQSELAAADARADRAVRSAAALNEQLAEASAERERARDEACEQRRLLDHHAAEWQSERDSLVAALEGLQAELAAAAADTEREHLQGELTELRDLAWRFEQQAAWADRQIAALVESEATLTKEISRKNSELDVAMIRLSGLEANLRSADEERRDFIGRVLRLVDGEAPPGASILDLLAVLHRRTRELDREIDQQTAVREHMAAQLARWQKPKYVAVSSLCRQSLQALIHVVSIAAHRKRKTLVN